MSNLSASRITAYANHYIGVIDVIIFVDIVLFLVLAYFIFKETKYTKNNGLVFISNIVISMAIFMSTPLSKWLWSVMKPLKTIQFPWRWMAYLELGLIFLLATYLKDAKCFKDLIVIKKYRLAVYTFSALLVISILCILFPNHHLPENVINKILYPESFGYDVGLPREYTPVWAVDLEKILTLPPPERISVISGKANARAVSWEPEKRVIEVQAESPAALRVATFYYPGWVAESNGKRKTVSMEKKSGAMLVDLKPGDRVITLSFIDTAVRRIAKYISLFSCLLLFLILITTRYIGRQCHILLHQDSSVRVSRS